jgi:hypothetical protein
MAGLSVKEDIETIFFLRLNMIHLLRWFYLLRYLIDIEVLIWIWLSWSFVPLVRRILFEWLLWTIFYISEI